MGFEESLKKFPKNPKKFIFTGNPVRKSILSGDQKKGYKFLRWNGEKPILLVIGGSSGAKAVNDLISEILPDLLEFCRVVHITGPSKQINPPKDHQSDYRQYEYLNDELADIFKVASLVISRAGANSIAEFIKLGLPNVLIPLPKLGSRGDQIENANLMESKGCSKVLSQEDLTGNALFREIKKLLNDKSALAEQKENLKKIVNATSL